MLGQAQETETQRRCPVGSPVIAQPNKLSCLAVPKTKPLEVVVCGYRRGRGHLLREQIGP
jgi:hypothetical protein